MDSSLAKQPHETCINLQIYTKQNLNKKKEGKGKGQKRNRERGT